MARLPAQVEEYTVAVPVSLYQAYANLEAELGRTITEDDKSNINHIYSMIAGAAGAGTTTVSSFAEMEAVSTWTSQPLPIPTARMLLTL